MWAGSYVDRQGKRSVYCGGWCLCICEWCVCGGEYMCVHDVCDGGGGVYVYWKKQQLDIPMCNNGSWQTAHLNTLCKSNLRNFKCLLSICCHICWYGQNSFVWFTHFSELPTNKGRPGSRSPFVQGSRENDLPLLIRVLLKSRSLTLWRYKKNKGIYFTFNSFSDIFPFFLYIQVSEL